MFLLDYLPATVYWLILTLGFFVTVAGFFLGMIPVIGKYKIPIQILGIAILAFGLYMIGRTSNEEKWQARVKELEADVARAENRASTASATVVTKYVVKREVVQKQGEQIIQYVDREVVKYDNRCEIPRVVIDIHNAAAQNKPLPEMQSEIKSSADDQDTVITPNTVVNTTTHNSAAIRLPKRAQ